MIEMKLINITHIDPIDGMVHIYGAVQRRFDLIGNAHVERIDLLMDDKVNKHWAYFDQVYQCILYLEQELWQKYIKTIHKAYGKPLF